MRRLGRVRGQALLDAWSIAESIELGNRCHSRYAPTRVEKWYRYASNLQSVKLGRDKIWLEPEPHERLAALGDRLYPGWNSLLVCGGNLNNNTSTDIKWHRDHEHFVGKAIMLNLGVAEYYEQPNRESNNYDSYLIENGEVIEIDTKLLHMAEQVSDIRYNFTYRKIKSQFLG